MGSSAIKRDRSIRFLGCSLWSVQASWRQSASVVLAIAFGFLLLPVAAQAQSSVVDRADDQPVVFGAAMLALSLGLLGGLAFLVRERHVPGVPKYLSAPPEEGLPPAYAVALASEGYAPVGDALLATLLDLVDRGYYSAGVKKQHPHSDLTLRVAGDRPSTDELEDWEAEVVCFFDDLLGGKSVALLDMRMHLPGPSPEWAQRFARVKSGLQVAGNAQLRWEKSYEGFAVVVVVAFVAVLVALGFTASFVYWLAAGVLGLAFLYLLVVGAFKRLDPESRERNVRWQAFKRWTRAFPGLQEGGENSLALWRRIVVYATAFDTVNGIIRSGRITSEVAFPERVVEGDEMAGPARGEQQQGLSVVFYHPDIVLHGETFARAISAHVAPRSAYPGGGDIGGGGDGDGGGGGG